MSKASTQQLLDLADEELRLLNEQQEGIELLPIVGLADVKDPEIAARKEKIKWDLIHRVGSEEEFAKRIGQIIRAAVDYVIDAPTLSRYSIDDLDPDEKTAIGKRIERMLRFQFKLPYGEKLDIKLGGEDVDIKTTMGKNWMFSKSSHGHMNLLIAYDEKTALFQLGIAYVLEHQLGAQNRDRKQSLTAAHRETIYWILKDQPYPPNFLDQLPPDIFKKIISEKTGMKRVLQLLRLALSMPIPRHIICSVANQKDPLRRVRSNGGARDILWEEGLLVLSGAYECDRKISMTVIGRELADDEMLTLRKEEEKLSPDLIDGYKKWHQIP
ncbi:MAG TPA: NaeI family type II restriction endonuclease [Noviherbaspirillum sp.]|nr:NaeI family type II restriction endonuclease [Noviherbaspirillum sp.]